MELIYKNIEEQKDLILSKNILIKNEKRAKEILFRENYYNLITGYKDVFLEIKKGQQEIFQKETFFEEIYAIYKFDRELRNLMLNYIARVETNLKSCIANIFSAKYGTKDYLKKENFYVPIYKEQEFQIFLNQIEENLNRNLDNYPEFKIAKETYQTIPLWMLTTLMTFGTTIKFYEFLKREDQKEIAKYFYIQHQDLMIFLKMLNIIRNISAHGNVLFNVRLKIKYPIHKTSYFHDELQIRYVNDQYESGINDLLAILIILKRLLEYQDFQKMKEEFISMILEVKKELDPLSFSSFLKEMGIPQSIKF